jgi:hypothetical protein
MDSKENARDAIVYMVFIISFAIGIPGIIIAFLFYFIGKKMWEKKILLEE